MVTVVAQKPISPPEPSNSTCSDELADLPVGTTFEALLTGFEPGTSGSDNCLSGQATITRSDDWTWQVPASRPRPTGSHAIQTRFDASRGTCRGTVDIRLTGTIPSIVPPPGMQATATLSRVFQRSAGDDRCPTYCVGHFEVSVAKR